MRPDTVMLTARLPLLVPVSGWAAGVAAGRIDIVPSAGLPWMIVILSVLLFFRHRQLRVFCLAGLSGLVWAGLTLMWDARLVVVPDGWLGAPKTVTAKVLKVRHAPHYVRLLLDDVRWEHARLAGRALLYAHGKRMPDVRAGSIIQATALWRLPENRRNPGAFDYRSYCFDRHIAVTGGLRGPLKVLRTSVSWLDTARRRIRVALASQPDAGGSVLAALLLADKSGIPTDVYDAFAASGAAHLLAISGLHVGMVAVFAGLLCWWVLGRREAWIIHLPLRRTSLLVGMAAAAAYATLAGWPLPAQRAMLMLAATAAAWWLREHTVPFNSLLAALALMLFFDAGAVASVSLWLSFTAAAALLLWAGRRRSRKRGGLRPWLAALLWTSLVATLATLPVIATVFGRLPVYGVPANLFLVPLYSFVVLPATLLGGLAAAVGVLPVAKLLFAAAGQAVSWGNAMLMTVYGWPGGNLWIPSVPAWLNGLYVAGMLAAGWTWFRTGRRAPSLGLAGLTLCMYVAGAVVERPPGQPKFIAWDVGQGAAASLLLPGGVVLTVDAPGMKGSRFNGGTITVAGLRALGMAHIDTLVLSHAQADHMGGIPRLITQVRHVRELWLADVPWNHAHAGIRSIVSLVTNHGGTVRWLKAGDQLHSGAIDVRVLWPPAGYAPVNHNNASLVLSLRLSDGTSLLLPGDIEARAEAELIARGLAPHALLLVPHHGSRTSSTPGWVQALAPVAAIVQSGRHNRYGFPAPEITERYIAAGAVVRNTAMGAVMIDLPGRPGGQMKSSYFRPDWSERRQRALQWWQRHL